MYPEDGSSMQAIIMENMEKMKRVFFQQFSGFIKLALGFSWKPHHHIGADADSLNLIHGLLNFLNKLA